LVETNYDHWKAPLFIDDRITPANTCMNKMGQSVKKCSNFVLIKKRNKSYFRVSFLRVYRLADFLTFYRQSLF